MEASTEDRLPATDDPARWPASNDVHALPVRILPRSIIQESPWTSVGSYRFAEEVKSEGECGGSSNQYVYVHNIDESWPRDSTSPPSSEATQPTCLKLEAGLTTPSSRQLKFSIFTAPEEF